MITIKNEQQLASMRKAGRIVRDVLAILQEHVKEGVSTHYLDTVARQYIEKCNAVPSFLGYNGYPASVCISINEQVVHGIPSKHRIIKEGDLVSFDVGAIFEGYHGDAARSVGVGHISEEKAKLIKVCEESFFYGIQALHDGARLGDMSSRIQQYVEANGFSVVRDLIGHGIGTEMHEPPDVPNFGIAGRGLRLVKGMTIAVEPMINAGTYRVQVLDDDWTIVTADMRPSAHYENTLAITADGYELLTL